jgi:hypothetical protein
LTDQAKPLQIQPREKGNIPFFEGKYTLFSRYGRYSMHKTKAAANTRESAEATCAKESAAVVRGRERARGGDRGEKMAPARERTRGSFFFYNDKGKLRERVRCRCEA